MSKEMKKILKEIGRDAQSDFHAVQRGMPAANGSYDRERLEHQLRSVTRVKGLGQLLKTGFSVVSLEEYDEQARQMEQPLDELWQDQLRMDPQHDLTELNWEKFLA